ENMGSGRDDDNPEHMGNYGEYFCLCVCIHLCVPGPLHTCMGPITTREERAPGKAWMAIKTVVSEAMKDNGVELVFCDRSRGIHISDVLVAKFFGGEVHWVEAPFEECKGWLQEAM
ncbi:unnamed protein product, partial [Prorocentrum cordatum]